MTTEATAGPTEATPGPVDAAATTLVACATNDGEVLTGSHFGSARIFSLYERNGEGFRAVGQVENSTEGEKEDGDRRKARSVVELLTDQGVDVVLARRYGPNIRRIRSKLISVVTGAMAATQGMAQLDAQWPRIKNELTLPPAERRHIVLSSNGERGTDRDGRVIARVETTRCRGCALCVEACPVDAMQMNGRKAVVDAASCVGCGACGQVCPSQAISFRY